MGVVRYVEGFHQIPTRVRANIERGWTVYNAPRPLLGMETWNGDFRHGVFFAAVAPEGDPADEFGDAPTMHERNQSLDGWPCVIVTREQIREYYDKLAVEFPIVTSAYPWPAAYEKVVASWFNSLED